jgi:hypothetical protein
MGIVMRIIQQYDPAHESEFMTLEKKFAALEKGRSDFPKGRRLQPVSGGEPTNTLIWQCDFPDIDAAYKALDFFSGDEKHEELFRQQVVFMKQVKIEFYKSLDY